MRVEDAVVVGVGFTMVVIALLCAPGMADTWILAMPSAVGSILPVWLVWGISDAVVLPKLIGTWTLAPLLAALSLCLAVRRRPSRAAVAFAVLAIFYALWTAVANSNGLWPALGWESVTALVCIACVGASLAVSLDPVTATRVLSSLCAGAVMVSIYSLCQHFGLDPLGWDPRHSEPDRSIATFGNPDFFAAWLVALVPVVLWRSAQARAPRAGALWGVGLGLVLGATIFSYTRAAWLALFIEASMLLIWRCARPSRETWIAFTITFCAIALALKMQPGHGIDVMERIGETVKGDRSTSVRIALWREALAVTADHPLVGTGPDSFSYAAMPYRGIEPPDMTARVGLAGDPHSTFLEVAASSGVPGLLLVLCLLAVAARTALRSGDDAARTALIGGIGLCVAQSLARLTLPSLWLAFVLGAICVAFANGGGRTSAPPVLTAAILLVGVTFSVLAVRWWMPMARVDFLSNLAGSEGTRAMEVGGAGGADLMRESLALYEEARSQAVGLRRGRIAAAEARLLEGLMQRMSVADATASGVRDNAVRRALEAVEMNRFDPYLWHDLSRIMMTASQRTADPRHSKELENQAIEAARQGCSLDPFNVALEADLARRLAIAHRNDEADVVFRHSLQSAPQQIGVRIDHARMLYAAGRSQEAEDELREVVRREPGNAVATKMLRDEEQDVLKRRAHPLKVWRARDSRRSARHGGH